MGAGDNVRFERQGSSRFLRQFSYEGSIPCYLCLDKVRNSEWDSGEHRRKCAYFNQRELLSFPQPYDAYCPECHERLRLWPAKGHPFYCDECPTDRRDVLKRSTGQNRLNCFLCDYDCCVTCSDASRLQRVGDESSFVLHSSETNQRGFASNIASLPYAVNSSITTSQRNNPYEALEQTPPP